jgi:hypothetical protein
MTDMLPYRSAEMIPNKPKMGLICAKKEVKPKVHRCDTPYIGMFRWLLFWLPTIKTGSVFRCPCGKAFEAIIVRNVDPTMGFCLWWDKCSIERWLEAGGVE